MAREDNHINDEVIQELLKDISGEFHLSPEMILAFVDGRLSKGTNHKIQKHLDECSECGSMYEIIRKTARAEKDFEKETLSTPESVEMPQRVSNKVELYEVLSQNKDIISEEIAKLFLPEKKWFMVKLVIASYRNAQKSGYDPSQVNSCNELPIAAFSGQSEESEVDNDFQKIVNSVTFADYVCETLIESCCRKDEIRENIPTILSNGMVYLDKIETGQGVKDRIFDIVKRLLNVC